MDEYSGDLLHIYIKERTQYKYRLANFICNCCNVYGKYNDVIVAYKYSSYLFSI
jgi:hypothetical protein